MTIIETTACHCCVSCSTEFDQTNDYYFRDVDPDSLEVESKEHIHFLWPFGLHKVIKFLALLKNK